MERLQTAIGEMNLTAEQKEKLDKVREEMGPKMKEIWGKVRGDPHRRAAKAAEEVMKKKKEAGTKGRKPSPRSTAIKLTNDEKPKIDKVGEMLLTLQREA